MNAATQLAHDALSDLLNAPETSLLTEHEENAREALRQLQDLDRGQRAVNALKLKNEAERIGLEFDVYTSQIDGAAVVHVDTGSAQLGENHNGPSPLRIYLNDGDAIYANPRLDGPGDREQQRALS